MTREEGSKNKISVKDKRLLFPLMFIPCILIRKSLDNDIWFLLNSGRYVINFGIPHVEPFTIHENMEFVMQQWLTSVLYWLAYSKFGKTGLFILIMVMFGIVIFLMYKLTTLISENNFFVSYALTIIFSVLIRFFMITRPMVFTIFFVILELYSLEAYIKYNNKRFLITLLIISLLIVNFHAAMWPMLFIILLPYVIDSLNFRYKFINGQGYEKKYIFITIILMFVVAFINPYGFKSMTYLFRSYGYSEISNTIIEMQPPNINDGEGIIIFILIFVIFLIYSVYRKGKTKIRYFLLTTGTCIMVLSSVRSFPFFIICSIFPLAYYLKDFNVKINNDNVNPKTLKVRKLLIVAIMILTLIAFFLMNYEEEDKTFNDLSNTIDYILENEDLTKIMLYTGYGDGALTEFRGLASYIDPRAEVFVKNNNNKDDIMKEYIDMQEGNIYYKEVLNKYKFTHLLVSEGDILNTYIPYDDDYKIIYSTDSCKLYKKIN